MKKTVIVINLALLLLSSCKDENLVKAEAKLAEAKCRTEFSTLLLENSLNTQLLLKEMGYGKELEEFRKLQSDTLVSCDSLKARWDELSKKAIK